MRSSLLRLLVVVLLALVLACSKPKPPTLVPKAAQVTAVDAQGVALDLAVEMTNPNGFTLEVRGVTGRVVLADGSDLGEVRVNQVVSLPPSTPTLVKVPMSVHWAGVALLAANALSGRDLPFTVSGTVAVGGEKLNVDVPYSIGGTITQEQLRRAATTSLGKLKLP